MPRRYLQSLGPLLGLLLFAGALWVVHHALREYHYHDVVQSLEALPARQLAWALLLTILNYLALTGYDTLAVAYIHHPLPYGKIAFASFIGYVFSYNIGLSGLGGSAVRYRLYSAWGLSALEVAQVVAFCTLTFWLGLLTLGGPVLLLAPPAIPDLLHLPQASERPLGVAFVVLVCSYLLWSGWSKKALTIRGVELTVPSLKVTLPQTAISAVDWVLAGSVFYAVLPPGTPLSYSSVLEIFLLAQIAGLVSYIPGGLGVFEAVVLHLLSPTIPAASLLGSLVAYRAIYYLLPLVAGAVLLGAHEIVEKRAKVQWIGRIFGRWVPELVPHGMAFATFLGGAVLLLSGATPAVSSRLAWLRDVIPLPLMELSHFLGSLAGLGLLLLARGLQQRLDAAYFLTALLLGAGVTFSLFKGLDYEEALILGILLIALLPLRRHFYRRSSLIAEPLTPGWIAAIVLVLSTSIWLGLFSHKHVEYSNELWWQFSLEGDAPRFLRATAAVMVAALFVAAAKLLRPAPPEPALPTQADVERARSIIQTSPKISAHLALLGDKTLLFSQQGNAFIMYGVKGRSWVAMGDPVGLEEELADLVWRFRELCDRHAGWTIFYEVDREHLPLYLDLGLTLLKVGEEGRVPLAAFSLEGGSRKGLRQARHRVERDGGRFDVIPADRVSALIPELKRISDQWLADKNTHEKRFSLGYFNPDSVKRCPIAVVRVDDTIVAFANMWLGARKVELSIDLMRYLPEAPHGVMEYLFIELMLWGRQEGFQWFNLGMAPLSGLESRPLAPLWNRIGGLVFRYGEHFYNFQGLRDYKEKFDPVWEPKYMASPGGISLPRILADVAALIGGGFKGVVTR